MAIGAALRLAGDRRSDAGAGLGAERRRRRLRLAGARSEVVIQLREEIIAQALSRRGPLGRLWGGFFAGRSTWRWTDLGGVGCGRGVGCGIARGVGGGGGAATGSGIVCSSGAGGGEDGVGTD
ncbi:hypothetical protein G7076_00750 [Sphingomonas sp. HDW15A]|uniref:hypothetical protein n=1 Tax=Sphingomonas sp. HDW15A TaxID=2714942 RepID=UPI00140BBA27|nr:hypothetical protein [Sphingomonas sp. HDW15A]QIK95214.1 hypothetical protein G7076_00750 [Sphingomonas sp. HDW15A]